MAMPNWISVNPEGGTGSTTVSVEASGNTSDTSYRTGFLTVNTASGISKSIDIEQESRLPVNVLIAGDSFISYVSI